MDFLLSLTKSSKLSWFIYNIRIITKEILIFSGYFGECFDCKCINDTIIKDHHNCLRRIIRRGMKELNHRLTFTDLNIEITLGVNEHVTIQNNEKCKKIILGLGQDIVHYCPYDSDVEFDTCKIIDYDETILHDVEYHKYFRSNFVWEYWELSEFKKYFDKNKNIYLSELNFNSILMAIYYTIEKNWITDFIYIMERLILLEKNIKLVEIQDELWLNLFKLALINNRFEIVRYILDNYDISYLIENVCFSFNSKMNINLNLDNPIIKMKCQILYIGKYDGGQYSRRYSLTMEKDEILLDVRIFRLFAINIIKHLSNKYDIVNYKEIEPLRRKIDIKIYQLGQKINQNIIRIFKIQDTSCEIDELNLLEKENSDMRHQRHELYPKNDFLNSLKRMDIENIFKFVENY